MARIVAIDDEPRLLKTVGRFLEAAGHEVHVGSTFDEVDERLWPGRFDVLLSDILMPVMSGMDVLRQIAERNCQEPVVLITGDPNLETASEAVRLGAFDYVPKPITKDKLLEVITRALRHVEIIRERDRARQNEIDLLRSLAQVGENAAVLAHEIRTPITSLNHALRAVADRLSIEHSAVLTDFVERLSYLERLMQRTLSFAKPVSLERQTISPTQVFDSVSLQLDGAPEMEGVHLESKVRDDIKFDADPTVLTEVLMNLARNAAEAVGAGGRIEFRAAKNGSDSIQLEVDDNGPGMPEEVRRELFELFRTSKHMGTGLGLAICRKLIEAHSGSIDLTESKLGGTCFHIELPQHT